MSILTLPCRTIDDMSSRGQIDNCERHSWRAGTRANRYFIGGM